MFSSGSLKKLWLPMILALKSDVRFVKGDRLHIKLQLSDWTNLDAEVSDLIAAVRAHEAATPPYEFLAVATAPEDQLIGSRQALAEQPARPAVWRGERYAHDRIRIGYLSADLREHPVARLAAGLFEAHDKSRFETIAFSSGPDDGSDLRHRIKSAFEDFVDVQRLSDSDLAALIRRREIDILVDLTGFTLAGRFGVLARRPAPIQVNFLGYPATMGAAWMDYIIADRTIIPAEHFQFYGERVVWLPDTYQANDDKSQTAERLPTRTECGLPENAFVFCCFNNMFKINPQIFAVWMRLLAAKADSVLWLLKTNATAERNLRREAKRRGIAADRLIFAPRIAVGDHLARHQQADLFLDTLPYNAHTTASDALRAGLPLVTCLGETFAGRVAASLLKAVGLPELITTSLKDYEELALKLARDPALVRSIRDRLGRNRDACRLFDTLRFTRHIESAYEAMWQAHQDGRAPAAFAVASVGRCTARSDDGAMH